jgi:hypothetical protein
MEIKERKVVVQKIKLSEKDSLSMAHRYYNLLSAISNTALTKREVQLIAFTAIKGNISYSSYKEEFCKMYKSSAPTINNLIFKLKKSGLLIKDGGKIKVNPVYLIDFNNNLAVQITLLHG